MRVLNYILSSVFFFHSLILWAQADQNFDELNSAYDSLLRSDELGMNRLFYKHQNDILQNNLGPFGSYYYYGTASGLFEQRLIPVENTYRQLLINSQGLKPFTNVTYVNASRKEQLFRIDHIQRFGKLLSFDFELTKVSSPGSYRNQEANNTNFRGHLHYNSKNQRYEASFTNTLVRNFYELNGGLSDFTDFNQSLYDDPRSFNVHLATSSSYLKNYKYELEQRFALTKNVVDSGGVFYVKHHVSYERQHDVFFDNDPTSSLYNSIYLDSTQILAILSLDSVQNSEDSVRYNYLDTRSNQETLDSIFTSNLSNRFSLGYKFNRTSVELFFQKDIIDYAQTFNIDTISRGVDTTFHNDYAGLNLKKSFSTYIVEAIVKYGLSGYREADLLSEISVMQSTTSYNLTVSGGYFSTEPNLRYANYISNHFNWGNNFSKQRVLQLGINFELNKQRIELALNTKSISSALFHDTIAIPRQHNEALNLTTLSLAKEYSLKPFHFRTAVIYQLTSDELIAPLPELTARQIAYYETRIFKKALKIQLGFGASFSTNYYGYGFMPALRSFHVQQNQELGNYPTIDLFLNTYLKRAQIFLRYEHFNSGRNVHRAYTTANNPFLSRSLKFGVSWNLFD